MDNITIQNYRCFAEEQTVPLAPLTLLVGPNSTGKTSFLALVRALWDVAFRDVSPNFMEDPYNLGSFQDIVHRGSSGRVQATEFSAGFEHSHAQNKNDAVSFRVTFEDRTGAPFPVKRVVSRDDLEFEAYLEPDGDYRFALKWADGTWTKRSGSARVHRYSERADFCHCP